MNQSSHEKEIADLRSDLQSDNEREESKLNNNNSNNSLGTSDFQKYENKGEHGLLARIYDSGQGEKFNDLIKNPTKIKAMKAFITEDDIEMLNTHQDKTRTFFNDGSAGATGGMNHVSGNMQDLLSVTGFKIIDRLPPTSGDVKNATNSMIDRFRISATDFAKDSNNNTTMNITKSKWSNGSLEPKLSRPTTTIINLGTKYSAKGEGKEGKDTKGKKDSKIEPENEKENKENPLAELNKEIEESEHDEYMNEIHKLLRDAFQDRDHKMDFVYYLPSDKENYYELRGTTFKNIAKEKTYYTLSSKGLTVYIDKKPREFIKLAEWINEKQRYNVIAEIPFFKNFKIWRIITMWRKNIFKQKKIGKQNELQNSLLFNNENYNTRLIEHKKYCNEILNLKIVDMKVGLESNKFEKFREMQKELRKRNKKRLDDIHNKCQINFDTSLKTIFSKVQQKINDSNNRDNHNIDEKKGRGGKDKKKEKVEEKVEEKIDKGSTTDQKTILNEDEIVGFDNFEYKNKMKIKDECKNFVKLAYLFDYIMLDLLRRMYIFSMTDVLNKLQDYNMIDIPPQKENILNKNGEYVKPQIINPNRQVPYFMVQCKLANKPIEKIDYKTKAVKPFFVKATPDADFDPTAHIQIDKEEMEYQKQLTAGKTQKEIMAGGNDLAMQSAEDIIIKEINRPHYYYINYEPDCEKLKNTFIKEIGDTLGDLKVKGWKAHPRFTHYLRYMDDWDEKYAEWDAAEAKDLNVEEILKEDTIFTSKDTEITQKIKTAYNKCDMYLERLDPYLQYHYKQKSINKDILLDEFLKDSDEIFRLLFVYNENAKKVIERYVPFDEEIGMIKLNLEDGLRNELRAAQNSTIDFLKQYYPDKIHFRAEQIDKWCDGMLSKICGDITDEKTFLEKSKAKDELDIWYDINERKLNSMFTIVGILKNKGFEKITTEDVKMFELLNSKKFQLKTTWDTLNDNLNRSQDKLYTSLIKVSIPRLNSNTENILRPLMEPKYYTYDVKDGTQIILDNIEELERADIEFKKIEANSKTYNQFLVVLGQPEHAFNLVDEGREKIDILMNLWKALLKFNEDCAAWKATEFEVLDTKLVLDKCDEYEIIGRRAATTIKEDGSAIVYLITKVQEFMESMRVVDYLKCKDLTSPEQWQRIQDLFPSEENGGLVLRTKQYTLEQLLEIKVFQYEKEIREIQLEAMNYRELELKINDIKFEKKDIIIPVNQDKKIIENFSLLISSLEELQSKINNVVASKYAKLFRNKIDKDPFMIKKSLEDCLNSIDFLKMFQKKYKYLENIINSGGGEMKRKLSDSSSFDKVDTEWKIALNRHANQKIDLVVNIKKNMEQNSRTLDKIQQDIEVQLQEMRNRFERFYFISNDDLLYMLANSKNSESKGGKEGIEMIKPYLSKIYEDIYDIKYIQASNSSAKEITSIFSLSKEELLLQKNFSENKVKIDDDLERTLSSLEQKMCETVKDKMMNGYQSYEDIKEEAKHKIWLEKIIKIKEKKQNEDRKELETTNISQVVATISHVKFCENTQTALKELPKEQSSLMVWYSKIEQAILSYSKMVNEPFANQNKNLRRIISNLITHYVHYKDIMKELNEVEPSIDDFEWQKQLRAYFGFFGEDKNFTIVIKQLKYEYEYGYEYFGPSTRIVISPLTDRVWLTMSSALQIKLGCSLGGPAGTGKTETTKDLAKFFGIQCIVFNCSEQIDYKILGNIFSGLCLHKNGAYACLDEFNRINVEVLSVIATQLFKIRQAQLSGSPTVTITTSEINLIGKSGVFITMNPTYSGRSELPDNLKANFRPITMMKPEFSKIAQVKLYSEGFSESDALSKKLYKLYELAQQQLSQQDHYDFTLRALGTVLSMAGNLKRNTKSEVGQEKRDEDKIILSSLQNANFPKFIAEDIKLFKALLTDLFPEVQMEEQQSKFFRSQLNMVMSVDNIDPSPFSIEKCEQLIDIMNIRLGVCLTGPAGTGKTTVIKLVKNVCTKIRGDYNDYQEKLKEKEKEKEKENERKFEDLPIKNSEPAESEPNEENNNNNNNKVNQNGKEAKEGGGNDAEQKKEEEIYIPTECDPKYKLIKTWTINPKSITMGELFGEENEEKKIFEYGIATKKIKKALLDEGEDKYRIVILDGPIDTKWIENMNSVLDDSQTLCLANGERIKLKSHVKVFFEVEDLSKASLATVSRLGVVYFGPLELGWRPYAHYWMKTFFKDETVLPKELQNYVDQLFEDKVDDVIDNIDDLYQTGCCFMKPTISSIIMSLCNLLEFYLTVDHGFKGRQLEGLDNQDQLGRYKKWVISCFALSMVWGMFGFVNNKGAPRVESFIRNKFNEIKLENSQVIMEHYYDFEKKEFVKFSTESTPFKYEKGMPFSSIYVPTIDSMRYSFILNVLLSMRRNVYITGETGTGKTAIIQNIIKSLDQTQEWTFITMNFSAQTSSRDIQTGLENKLEQEKGKKKLWGKGGKKCLIYIDDINMPEPNEWGSHPPIELLRQYLDQHGWFNRPQFFWKTISNTNMIVAGGPPVGGRSLLSDRFTRHFTLICFPQPNKQVLNYIFENILREFFKVNIFGEVVKKYSIETTTSTIELYEFMLSNMKPIPSKFHYVFNLRDVSRVFQGILMIESKNFQTAESYIKLWVHEIERVFCDRLTNAQDLKEVRDVMCQLLRNKFKQNYTYDQLYKNGPPIYYGEVHKGLIPNRPYEYITDHKNLTNKLKSFVIEYNSKNKTAPMNCVFFDYFICHILRVCRVLRQPRGSMVLIGHGGSGKQTVCQLSSFIMTGSSERYLTFSAPRNFKVEEFKNIIKVIIRKANYFPVCLLLNDNNVEQNFILENINNFLNNGEIPGLLEMDYQLQVGNLVPPMDFSYEQFVENSRTNLHVLFCTSPVGENLRLRMRKFPALINCCLLDWFMPWPQSALESCSKTSFQKIESYDDDIKLKLVKLVCEAHQTIETLKDDFFDEFGRKVYITPKTFLDMNETLKSLLQSKKSQNDKTIKVLEDGTKKIKKTQADIKNLEEEIRILEPQIAEKAKYMDNYVKKIKEKKDEVTKQTTKVNDIMKKAKVKQKESTKLLNTINSEKDKCSRAFELIKLRVKEKLGSDTLLLFAKEKPNTEFKAIVPEALAFFLKGKHTKCEDNKSYAWQVNEEKDKITKIEEILQKNLISDSVFEVFKQYIHEKIPKVFEKYHPEIEKIEDKLSILSIVHQTLYIWGKGVIDLWEIDKQLRPLKEDSKKMQEEVNQLEATLESLKKEQEAKQKALNDLEEERNKSQAIINELEEKKEENTRRKNNAAKLINLLKDENDRWNEQLKQLHEEENNFLGDIILSSLFISYLSPFSGNYRKKEVKKLIEICDNYKIKVSKNYSLEKVMTDVVEIRKWTMNGLPNDTVSIENAIMFTNNPKFPLFIDPQLQANQWLKKMLKNEMKIYKADCKQENLKTQLENISFDISQGRITMLENITDIIDSDYSPIVNQAIFDDNGTEKIKFNGNDREYNRDFKMYFTTKYDNPHYPPEYYIKLNIINFTVTQNGLSEQLLSEVFKCERREKYEQRDMIIAEMGNMNDQLAKFSEEILKELNEIEESKILDAVLLIEHLEQEKVMSDDLNKKIKINRIIEKETNEIRNKYIPVSVRGSILYFVVASMSKIDPMYQFSLEYFKKIFINSISYMPEDYTNNNQENKNMDERVKYLEKKITEDIFKNIKRGIFESHKTVFSFLIDINIRKARSEITDDEFNMFVKGPPTFDTSEMLANPDDKYFSEFQWNSILYLEDKFKYTNIAQLTKSKLDQIKEGFEKIENLNESFDNIMKPIFDVGEWSQKLIQKNFIKLLFIKIYKPNRLLYFSKLFIKDDLSELFIDTTPSRLEEVYQESDWKTPIIFILSKGADPTNEFQLFKERFEKIRKEKYEEELKRKEEEMRIKEAERLARLERGGEEEEEEKGEEGEEPDQENNDQENNNQNPQEEETKNNPLSSKSVNKTEDQNGNNQNNDEKGDQNNKNDADNKSNSQKEENQAEPEQNAYEFKSHIISLGQGQEAEARNAILEGIKKGNWVLLQNCHLFTSFMPDLAIIVQSLQQDYTDNPEALKQKKLEQEKENAEREKESKTQNQKKGKGNREKEKHIEKEDKHKQQQEQEDIIVNPNFRLWLTSMPVKTFPVSILQNSLKLTTEPPSGIKPNMKKLFNEILEEKTNPIVKPLTAQEKAEKDERTPEERQKEEEQAKNDLQTKKEHFIKILFTLSMFHSVLQERKKFGPIGFNLRYDFNQGDFDTSSQLVNIYLSEADVDFVPWDSILYLIGEVTYGGSIVDETDRIVMNSTLVKFINENLFDKIKDENGEDLKEEKHISFGDYAIPAYKTLAEYQKYITTLPNFDDPGIFGLNDNANIAYQIKEMGNFINNLTYVLPKDINKKAGGKTSNEVVIDIIGNIFAEQLELIDKKARNKIHDKIYDNELKHPLTIVLGQEIDRYNNLLIKIDTSLKELKGAIEGITIMSNESDEIYNSLLLNKIPLAWSKISYSSFKSFGSWLNDLKKRIDFIQDWLVNGHPNVYWISGLFYPQGFITGVYQNHARETKIAVSDITIKFTVMNIPKEEVSKGPSCGIYAYGLYLEGASWDEKKGLVDQKPGEMRFFMPVIWFQTVKDEKVVKEEEEDDENAEDEIFYYSCPMFKTGKRASIIAASGNSIEKIIDVDLPSKFNKDHWILRGAALLTQLDD